MYFTPRRYPFAPLASDSHEAVVAGGGPVGLAVALGLARRGVQVTVLEDDDSACFGSRAICLSRHSLEVLDRLGAGRELTGQALPWTSGRSFYRDTEVLSFDMPHADGDPHPPMVNISQSAAEQVLIDAAARTPGLTIAWRHRVRSVRDAGDRVRITVTTPGGERELTAGWLVAADGARSAVRDSLGLRLTGTSYTGSYLIADIHWKSPLPVERRVWFDPPASPGQTVILHRQPDDIWRFDCQLPPGSDPDAALDEDHVRRLVKTHLDWIGNTRPWTLQWSSVYSARALSLDSYRHGRVVFAGDAAHLVPIFGVRGLNSGLEDAETLAWTLACVVRGAADEALLDGYAAERRDAWRQNIASADLSTLFMTPGTDGYRATRDAVLALARRHPELRELINPRQSSATHARSSPLTVSPSRGTGTGSSRPPAVSGGGTGLPPPPLPGDPVPDVPLGATSLHAARGPDFTLLRFGAGTSDAEPGSGDVLAEFAARLRERLAPAVGVRVLGDAGGALAAALGAAPGEIFVIRPDGLLLARFAGEADLGDADALAGHILRGGTPATEAVTASEAGLSAAEQAWRALSDALDATDPADRAAFLTRLALLLALDQRDPAEFAAKVAEARRAG